MGITQSTSNNKSNDKTKEIIKQIEELTEKRISNILFDSDKDDWNKNTSVFIQRILNKKYIIIIIEDEEGNRFGGYVSEKIDKVGRIYDSKSFVFSLESKGRLEGMIKFDIRQPQYAFYLYNKSHDILFSFGNGYGDILVYKENDKTRSYCKQNTFDYKEIENALCGKYNFTPKRIIVIEMK
ncbi:trichohyalin, putative [Entamoeba histolytica]